MLPMHSSVGVRNVAGQRSRACELGSPCINPAQGDGSKVLLLIRGYTVNSAIEWLKRVL
jgi:hypothetical protein